MYIEVDLCSANSKDIFKMSILLFAASFGHCYKNKCTAENCHLFHGWFICVGIQIGWIPIKVIYIHEQGAKNGPDN